MMKKLLFISVVTLLSTTAMAIDVNNMVSEFQQVDKECNQIAQSFSTRQTVKTKRQDNFDNDACYSWAVKTSMTNPSTDKTEVLMAALLASESRVALTTQTAIEAGMAPMAVVARANEVLPHHNDEISQGAIRAGVDPVVVTEATAAGKRQLHDH